MYVNLSAIFIQYPLKSINFYRLSGLDAQKRLRAAKVCLLGVRGLGCEVAKNLVLAGINSMKMVDNSVVTEEDATSQFLAPRDKVC